MESKPAVSLIAIVGPTASGKSAMAIRLARKFNGEIICADSQTIRRGLDIGTAKPTAEQRRLIKHHVLDIVGPYEPFTAADFQRLANEAIADIAARSKLPILVGGTGLYMDSVLFAYAFRGETNPAMRAHLSSLPAEELRKMVLAAGYSLPDNDKNPRHLIRILESAGAKPAKGIPRGQTLVLGLDTDKQVLAERIAKRIDNMLEQGFIEEVNELIKKYGRPTKNFDAIGYKIVLSNMDSQGNVDINAVRQRMNIADRQYAKRQKTWFRRNPNIQWITSEKQADKLITTFLSKFATIEQ